MLRFIAKEVDVSAVVHAGGQPDTRIVSFDGNQEGLELFLRYDDVDPDSRFKQYISRELVGVELL